MNEKIIGLLPQAVTHLLDSINKGLFTTGEKNKKSPPQNSISPFRYPGGKTRGLEQIISYIPKGITHLYSAFLGGGSIEIELASRGIRIHAYDLDVELVNCWQKLSTQPGKLSTSLGKYYPLSKEEFYRLKENFHEIKDPIEKAAAFLAINRTSFNGGVFTSGFSGNERFTESIIERVANFKATNLHVHHADFKEALALHPNGFFYLDPPYVGKENLYASSKLGFDHAGLAAILKKRGGWILSYGDCSEVRELYKGYTMVSLEWAYGMPKNKEAKELLILSKDHPKSTTNHKANALSIVGSSRRNGERESDDHYPTPGYVVEELLKRENFDGGIWEPACGEGNISKILKDKGFEVYSSDLIDRGYGEQSDFLATGFECDNIITNPPYKSSLDFVLHAKKLSRQKIAMFLKTVWLESEARYGMFQDKEFPLKTVYQFSKRVSLYKGGIKMKNSGMIAYAWFVWDRSYTGKPTIEWIK